MSFFYCGVCLSESARAFVSVCVLKSSVLCYDAFNHARVIIIKQREYHTVQQPAGIPVKPSNNIIISCLHSKFFKKQTKKKHRHKDNSLFTYYTPCSCDWLAVNYITCDKSFIGSICVLDISVNSRLQGSIIKQETGTEGHTFHLHK